MNDPLDGLCEVVRDHAKHHFQVYVKYCSNQVDQGKLLKELGENPRFVEALKELESSPVCQALKMQSFLMLPMQRITRLPLLIGAIFSRLEENSAEYEPCQEAMDIIDKVMTFKFLYTYLNKFRNFFLVSSISHKKRTKTSRIFFVRVLGKLRIPKSPFEIN